MILCSSFSFLISSRSAASAPLLQDMRHMRHIRPCCKWGVRIHYPYVGSSNTCVHHQIHAFIIEIHAFFIAIHATMIHAIIIHAIIIARSSTPLLYIGRHNTYHNTRIYHNILIPLHPSMAESHSHATLMALSCHLHGTLMGLGTSYSYATAESHSYATLMALLSEHLFKIEIKLIYTLHKLPKLMNSGLKTQLI